MQNIDLSQAIRALTHFMPENAVNGCVPHGNGHINGTFMVMSGKKRYILQAINGEVFKDPQQLMENVERVTTFMRKRAVDPRSVLKILPTPEGKNYFVDENGVAWRMYKFIEDAICPEHPDAATDIYQCALAFGMFQRDLHDFPAEVLHETIPDFHNTPKRYRDLLEAVGKDPCDRAASVQKEIAFFRARESFYDTLFAAHRDGKLPLRVTHNDTKCNNVMLDAQTHAALCVIDLDTVMPGFSVCDFGDAIRFGGNTAAEDEPDVSKVHLDLNFYDIYTRGFVIGCGGYLEPSEFDLLAAGAKMMTLECGMRFLTDYLMGDVYFKTAYPTHNLVRCHTQIQLAADMERNYAKMQEIAGRYRYTQEDAE